VRGVATRREGDRVESFRARELRDLAQADDLAGRSRDRVPERLLDLGLDSAFEHRLRPLADALVEHGFRDVEAEDQRRVACLLAPEPVPRGCERGAGLVELEGTDDSPAV